MKKIFLLLSFLIGILSYNIDVEAKEYNYFSDGNDSGGGSTSCYSVIDVSGKEALIRFCADCRRKAAKSGTHQSKC